MPAINYTVGATVRGFLAGMQRAVSATQALSAAAKGTVGAMHALNGASELVGKALGPLRSLAGALAAAIGEAGDLESTAVAYKTLLGSAEKATTVIGKLRALASSTPFETTELLAAGRKLIAFGESGETVANTLRKIGDVASGVQKDIGELAETYGKARVAGVLMAEEINEFTSAGVPLIAQLAKQMKVSEDQVKKLASEGKIGFSQLEEAFTAMTSKGGQFFGMMKEQGGTFNGLLSTLKDSWASLKTAFAEPVMLALKPVLEDGAKLLDGMKTQAAAIGAELGKWVTYIGNAFAAGKGMDAIWGDLKGLFHDVMDAVEARVDIMVMKLKLAMAETVNPDKEDIAAHKKAIRTAEDYYEKYGSSVMNPQAYKDKLERDAQRKQLEVDGNNTRAHQDSLKQQQQRRLKEREEEARWNANKMVDSLLKQYVKPFLGPAVPKTQPLITKPEEKPNSAKPAGTGTSKHVAAAAKPNIATAAERMAGLQAQMRQLNAQGNTHREAFLARRAVRDQRRSLRKELSTLKNAGKRGLAAAKPAAEKDQRRAADTLDRIDRKLNVW